MVLWFTSFLRIVPWHLARYHVSEQTTTRSDPGRDASVARTRPWQHTHYSEQMCCQRQRYRPKRPIFDDKPAWVLWANGGTECNPQCLTAVAWAAGCGFPSRQGTPRALLALHVSAPEMIPRFLGAVKCIWRHRWGRSLPHKLSHDRILNHVGHACSVTFLAAGQCQATYLPRTRRGAGEPDLQISSTSGKAWDELSSILCTQFDRLYHPGHTRQRTHPGWSRDP